MQCFPRAGWRPLLLSALMLVCSLVECQEVLKARFVDRLAANSTKTQAGLASHAAVRLIKPLLNSLIANEALVGAKNNGTLQKEAAAQNDNKSSSGDLLGSIKSFFSKLTAKIGLGAQKSIKRIVGAGQQQSDKENSDDKQKAKRLTRSEIAEEILSYIVLDDKPANKRRSTSSPTANRTELTRTMIAASEPASERRFQSSRDQTYNAKANRQVLFRERPLPVDFAHINTANRSRSTSDSFKQSLTIILEDQFEELNTTSVDLDHFIRLNQQRAAKSSQFQPIEQIKKVMSFMHFG